MTSAIDAYYYGDCTYYVATRFPNIYPYLGNALSWLTNAKLQGYTTLSKPAPDTVVVYGPGNGYSSLGHVAVVDSVNQDGTFMVSEMNYTGWDVVDHRRSTMTGVLGFFVPPGSSYKADTNTAGQVTQGTCVTGSFNFNLHLPGESDTAICFDPVVGIVSIAAGGLLMLSAVAIFIAFALKRSGIADKVGALLPLAGGPMGAAVAIAESSKAKPKPTETQPSQAQQDAAHNQRMATAKARLSPEAENAVSEARAGRGKKLSPAVKEELSA